MKRRILLIALVPLLGVSLVEVTRYDPAWVFGLSLSADGSQLRVIRGLYDESGSITSGALQHWDVRTGQLLRTTVTESSQFLPGQTGNVLFEVEGQQIRLRDADSLESRQVWRLPREMEVSRLQGTDRLAVVESFEFRGSLAVPVIVCLWVDSTHKPIVKEADLAVMSADGTRLFLSHENPQTGAWQTNVFSIGDGELIPEERLRFSGHASLVSRNGEQLLVVDRRDKTSLRDLRTGTSVSWVRPVGTGATCAVFFTPDGRQFRSLHEGGMVQSFEVATGRRVATRQMPGVWFDVHAFSADQRLFAGIDESRRVHVWDLHTGKVVGRFPDYRLRRWTVAALMVFWCVAWIWLGIRHQTHAAIDIGVLYVVVLSLLMSHAASRPRWGVHDALLALSLAVLASLAALLCLWWTHGRIRWSLRLAGMVAGLAGLAAMLLSGHRDDPAVWNIILGAISYLAVVSLLLWCWRRCGLRVAADVRDASERNEAIAWQLPLKDALIVTTAAGLLVGVLRFSIPSEASMPMLAYLSSHGIGIGVASVFGAWAALSQRTWKLRLPVLMVVAATTGVPAAMFYTSLRVDPPWWCVTLHAMSAATVFLATGALRLRGVALRVV